MTNAIIAYILLGLIGLFLSALFSGMETGVYSLNRVRLLVRAGRGDRQAIRLQREFADSNRLLSTLLIGNNIANYMGIFGVAGILTELGYGPTQVIVINAAILIPLLFVFGETLPKDLFRTHSDRWSYTLSAWFVGTRRILSWIGLVLIVKGFGAIFTKLFGGNAQLPLTERQRISNLMKEGVGSGALSEAQTALADRALSLGNRTVADEMIPWEEVASISAEANDDEREHKQQTKYTRLPVLDSSGLVVGTLSILDMLLTRDKVPSELMTDAMLLGPATTVRTALRTMRAQHQTLAVVVDPSSERPIGLVTLKNLVEPFTGKLAAW